MFRFAANLSMMYADLDFISRFGCAARDGFRGVEYLFPYAYPKEQLAEALSKSKLKQVLHNLPAGDWDTGDRGIASNPDRAEEFKEGVDIAIEYALALDCQQLNCLVGKTPTNIPFTEAYDTAIDNLKFAARRLAEHKINLLIEPLNTYDIPGFFPNKSIQALDLIAAVAAQNVFMQYDVYHMQIMEGNLASTIEKHLRHILHIQIADFPGRHEPGTGEIRFDFLFQHLNKIGYQGWIGCEYHPLTETRHSFDWMPPGRF